PALIWRGPIVDRAARLAARTVRLVLGAAAAADDDQQVLVNPGDLGAGQAGQERRDARGQLLRRVEGEGRVVAPLGLGPDAPGAWPPALSCASMPAETSPATSSEPTGSSPHSSREYRPVPQPISRPVTGRSGKSWPILRTGASSVVRSDS